MWAMCRFLCTFEVRSSILHLCLPVSNRLSHADSANFPIRLCLWLRVLFPSRMFPTIASKPRIYKKAAVQPTLGLALALSCGTHPQQRSPKPLNQRHRISPHTPSRFPWSTAMLVRCRIKSTAIIDGKTELQLNMRTPTQNPRARVPSRVSARISAANVGEVSNRSRGANIEYKRRDVSYGLSASMPTTTLRYRYGYRDILYPLNSRLNELGVGPLVRLQAVHIFREGSLTIASLVHLIHHVIQRLKHLFLSWTHVHLRGL